MMNCVVEQVFLTLQFVNGFMELAPGAMKLRLGLFQFLIFLFFKGCCTVIMVVFYLADRMLGIFDPTFVFFPVVPQFPHLEIDVMNLVLQMIDFRISYYLGAGNILTNKFFVLFNNFLVEYLECKAVFTLIGQPGVVV